MKKTILIFGMSMMSLIPIAFAQTGLFSSEGATSFATVGIIIIIFFFVVKGLIVRMFRRKK